MRTGQRVQLFESQLKGSGCEAPMSSGPPEAVSERDALTDVNNHTQHQCERLNNHTQHPCERLNNHTQHQCERLWIK